MSEYNHSHDFHIHLHLMRGFTTFDLDHCHKFCGKTDYARSGVQHVHYYSIYTSFDRGHSHLIYGYTGPAIFLPDGRHYHLFQGRTSVDGSIPHSHEYFGATSL